jgi:hypothetical protein
MAESAPLKALPCPFCGCNCRVFFKRISNRRSGYFAECLFCEVRQARPAPTRDAAVEAWNCRTTPPRPAAHKES